MSNPVIFKDLPATFPEEDRFQKPSIVSSIVLHVLLIATVVLIPLLFPQRIEQWRLVSMLITPMAPPPAAAPIAPLAEMPMVKPSAPKLPTAIPVNPDALIAPVTVPKDIAVIVDEPVVPGIGVVGGVPGGIPGGIRDGALGGFLAANIRKEAEAPLPPPPPPPIPPALKLRGPIRVGGDVREPQVIKLVPPVYPILALKAHVTGTVVLEATITAEGTVDEIHVVSGHPLLIPAAIEAMRQWLYEPTYLNGEPVPVILTAHIAFNAKAAGQ